MKILIKVKAEMREARCPALCECKRVFMPRPCDIEEWHEYESVNHSQFTPCYCTPTLEYSDEDRGEWLLERLERDFNKTHKRLVI